MGIFNVIQYELISQNIGIWYKITTIIATLAILLRFLHSIIYLDLNHSGVQTSLLLRLLSIYILKMDIMMRFLHLLASLEYENIVIRACMYSIRPKL